MALKFLVSEKELPLASPNATGKYSVNGGSYIVK